MARSRVRKHILALILTGTCLGPVAASDDDRFAAVSASGRFIMDTAAAREQMSPRETCEVTLDEIGLHAITYAGQCLALDFVSYHGTDEVSFTSNFDGKVFFADPDSGAELSSFTLNPANNGAFGNHEWNGMFFNDWSQWDRYFTDSDGIGWSTYDNPASNLGRGMDFDSVNQLVWETYSSTGLYAFGPTNSSGTFFDLSAWITSQMSGLAVFPDGAGTGIAVASYSSPQILFFTFAEGAVTYAGCAVLPVTNPVEESFGLAYSENRRTFFWSYESTSGQRWLSELDPSGPGFSLIFGDGFETGNTTGWSSSVP